MLSVKLLVASCCKHSLSVCSALADLVDLRRVSFVFAGQFATGRALGVGDCTGCPFLSSACRIIQS